MAALGAALLTPACGSSPADPLPSELAIGTWGSQDAGVLVGDELTHVHVGCTYGNFPAEIAIDDDARFSVPGEYQLRAYPVVLGPNMPARLVGIVEGDELTVTVAVNDTISGELVVLGPLTVRYGEEPEMAICPICTMPSAAPSGS